MKLRIHYTGEERERETLAETRECIGTGFARCFTKLQRWGLLGHCARVAVNREMIVAPLAQGEEADERGITVDVSCYAS